MRESSAGHRYWRDLVRATRRSQCELSKQIFNLTETKAEFERHAPNRATNGTSRVRVSAAYSRIVSALAREPESDASQPLRHFAAYGNIHIRRRSAGGILNLRRERPGPPVSVLRRGR